MRAQWRRGAGGKRTCGRVSACRPGGVVGSLRVVGEAVVGLIRGRALVSGRLVVDGREGRGWVAGMVLGLGSLAVMLRLDDARRAGVLSLLLLCRLFTLLLVGLALHRV